MLGLLAVQFTTTTENVTTKSGGDLHGATAIFRVKT